MASAAQISHGPDPELMTWSDADLIGAAATGNARALEVLYDRYNRVVYGFALRIVGDPTLAEELLQEVFFRAWQQGAAFRASRGTFATWLLSVTHNLAIDQVRKRQRRPQTATGEAPEAALAAIVDPSPDIADEVWLGTLRDRVAEALATLPRAQSEVIELAYFQGLTQREIAETLGEPLGTVKTRLRLGMLKLKDALQVTEGGTHS